MTGKSNTYMFQVQLDCFGKMGLLSAKDVNETLRVATSRAFGGEGKPWTPEHLLLVAISSGFMTTCFAIAQKMRLEIADLECEVIGKVELVENQLKFVQIDLYSKIYIENNADKEKSSLVLEKTQRHSIISNSIETPISYHSEIIILAPYTSERPVKKRPTARELL